MNPVIRSLHSYLTELAEREPQKPLLGGPDRWLDAAAVLERTEALAWTLEQQGIRSGDLVALRTRRSLETALTMLAIQAIGAVAVLTDPRKEPQEFLRNSSVEILAAHFIDPAGLDVWELPPLPFPVRDADPKAPGFIIFTSGSTGKQKAVMLSQYNLVNNLIDSQPLGYYREDDLALGALPMDHVFGLVLLAGVCVLGYGIFFPDKTDIPSILSAIETQKITRMNGVPSLYLAMAEQADQYNLSSLRAGFIGGGPCTPEQFRRIEEALQMTLISVYGMSECIGVSCASFREPWEVRASGVGRFYSMNTGKVLLEDGSEAAPGQEGEIWVTGPARMVGYYPNIMPEDELLPTGDLGFVDETGILHLTGRKKDIIIRNGNNLSARKIEEALLAIPGVEDAAVVGLPDEKCGEIPYAIMVCKEDILRRIWIGLHERLPKNEIPVEILRTAALPRTASGKTDKQRIREVIRQWKA